MKLNIKYKKYRKLQYTPHGLKDKKSLVLLYQGAKLEMKMASKGLLMGHKKGRYLYYKNKYVWQVGNG